jgi:predicted DNA-binding transcriptional regulator AlpA
MAKRKPHRADTGTGADQRVPPKQPAYVAFLGEHGGRNTPATPATTMAPHRRFGDRGDPDDAPLTRLVRYHDLEKSWIVRNRTQLERLIRDEGMPPGRMLSSKTRVWTVSEIEDWLGTRPPAGKRQDADAVIDEAAS